MSQIAEQIRPETINLLAAEAARRGQSADEFLRNLLLRNGAESTNEPETVIAVDDFAPVESAAEREAKRRQSILWIKSHRAEYGGMFVALDGDKLLGASKKYGEARAIARQKGLPNAFVGDVLPPGYEGSMGGFD